jgi:hypothetical protein
MGMGVGAVGRIAALWRIRCWRCRWMWRARVAAVRAVTAAAPARRSSVSTMPALPWAEATLASRNPGVIPAAKSASVAESGGRVRRAFPTTLSRDETGRWGRWVVCRVVVIPEH